MTKKVKLGDDRDFRIPKKFRIPRDCFASLAMTQRILEFPKLEFPKVKIPPNPQKLEFLNLLFYP